MAHFFLKKRLNGVRSDIEVQLSSVEFSNFLLKLSKQLSKPTSFLHTQIENLL